MKLELSVSTTNVLRTLMYLAKLLTQEELPTEPEFDAVLARLAATPMPACC